MAIFSLVVHFTLSTSFSIKMYTRWFLLRTFIVIPTFFTSLKKF